MQAPSECRAARPRPSSRDRAGDFCPLRLAAALVLAAALAPPALAQTAAPAEPPPAAVDGVIEARVRQIVFDASQVAPSAAGTIPPRIEMVVGQLDRRLRLAPCLRIEPYLPEGARPWGKTRVGLRCTEGPTRWNVYLPIHVKVFGAGLVATGGLAAGAVIGPADLATAEVDLAEEPSPALVAPDAVVGRALARALAPGQSLRASHLKVRQWFVAGETVTLVTQGAGFSAAGEAQALGNGFEGQPARLRTESGRIVSGMPVGERRVELGL